MPETLELEVCQPTPKIGRPANFSPAVADEVVDRVRAGYTVIKVAKLLGLDDCTLYRWQHENPDFREAVALARKQGAAAWADKAAEAAAEAMRDPGERGEKARGAAVMVGNAQWQAERRDWANWGARSGLAIDARITVAGETPLTYAEVMAARATRKERAAAVREARDGANTQAGGSVDVAASVAAGVAAAGGAPGT